MSTFKTFDNNPLLKATAIENARRHYESDQLKAGTFGTIECGTFRGCSVGCMGNDIRKALGEDADVHAFMMRQGNENSLHRLVASHYSLPFSLIRLQDRLFEALADWGVDYPDQADECKLFHVQLFEAIPHGVAVSDVHLLAEAILELNLWDASAMEMRDMLLTGLHKLDTGQNIFSFDASTKELDVCLKLLKS